MSMVTGQVSVGTTATLIVAARSRNFVTFVQTQLNDVWIGDATVTPTTGILLTGSKGTPFTWPAGEALYGVTTSGTSIISYAENF